MCQVFLIHPQIVFHRAAAAVLQFKIIESVYVWLLDALNCPRGKSFLPLGPNNPLQPQKKKHQEKKHITNSSHTSDFCSAAMCLWAKFAAETARSYEDITALDLSEHSIHSSAKRNTFRPVKHNQPCWVICITMVTVDSYVPCVFGRSLHWTKPIVVTSINI